ncbi:hypothetical protein AB1Y20_015148 [Prymnesium parvum]|uniref:Fe2OG dioxygenase domain-containing protein n=1 Tax=Prymnesium parvum TaxID=97485 RepID=A0AB34JZX3_PRYPA|mmetsp:Transcript_470/g.1291  ORF Transcript_470/g.1291 Transcript_470/m.1291 type:complete len:360 (-) Transcript_470:166-1245(-)
MAMLPFLAGCAAIAPQPLSHPLSPGAIDTIAAGQVHVERDWISPKLLSALRRDAQGLHENGLFSADGLTNNAKSRDEQGFQEKYDRQTFRNDGWGATTGNLAARLEFAQLMQQLKKELAVGLGRPTLASGSGSSLESIWCHHEMTYNWYEPGASLGRHLDEHHEETKGPLGWSRPSRRSVTWLVYLNDDWREEEGGALRCFPRASPSVVPVGADDANLQVGWLAGDCPVFLDSDRPDAQSALYCLAHVDAKRQYLSPDFIPTRPADFGKVLFPPLRDHFQQISTARLDPRFAGARAAPSENIPPSESPFNEGSLDVLPQAGTLVLFDSVTLPHKVLPVTSSRQRIAATGWFHEESKVLL